MNTFKQKLISIGVAVALVAAMLLTTLGGSVATAPDADAGCFGPYYNWYSTCYKEPVYQVTQTIQSAIDQYAYQQQTAPTPSPCYFGSWLNPTC